MATTATNNCSAFLAPFTSTSNENVQIPKLLYGTAWKKERTSTLVYQALKAGFRGVDTAAQPRHYQEDLVGEGIRKAIQDGILTREELYIQTKFTPTSGQDPKNMPYSASQSIPEQIHASVASSLSHLSVSDSEDPYIDCLLLHSPLRTLEETTLAWKTLESLVPSKIRTLGISNVPLHTLKFLYHESTVKPSVVQNRFYPETRWEVPLRQFCREKGIQFESFWTLTGNPHLMGSDVVKRLAQELEKSGIRDSLAVALYALVLGLKGVSILNGTTNQERMSNDLASLDFLGQMVENEWKGDWESLVQEFQALIGDK